MSSLNQIIDQIIESQGLGLGPLSDKIRENKKFRRIFLITLLVTILALIATSIYVLVLFKSDYEKAKYVSDNILPFVAVPAIFLVVLFILSVIKATPLKSEAELREIKQERIQLKHKIEEKKQPSIFDTIQLNLNQLNEYFSINKAQAK